MRFSILTLVTLCSGVLFISAGCADDDDDSMAEPGGAAGSATSGNGGKPASQGGQPNVGGKPATAGTPAVGGSAGAGGAGESSGGASAAGTPGEGGESVGGAGGLVGAGGVGGDSGGDGAGGAAEANLTVDSAAKTLLTTQGAWPRALYFFGRDVPASAASDAVSACIDDCLDTWPVFYEPAPVLTDALADEDFSELVRPDGKHQSTFKGWPLYLYSGDKEAGNRAGDGVGQLWHAVEQPFYSLVLMRGTLDDVDTGLYLADARGRTVYRFIGDQAGTSTTDPISTCTTQGCRNAWPVVAPTLVKPVSSINGAFDAFIRPDTNAVQLAYAGLPIYYFAQDLLPGDKKGTEKANWVLATP